MYNNKHRTRIIAALTLTAGLLTTTTVLALTPTQDDTGWGAPTTTITVTTDTTIDTATPADTGWGTPPTDITQGDTGWG